MPSTPEAFTYQAVLLDIEGTTTSIRFVYDVLFPFARDEAAGYLDRHWGQDELHALLSSFREQVANDTLSGLEGVVPIAPPEADDKSVRESWSRNISWQIEQDRKTTCLKALQGRIWNAGYQDGRLEGHVYPDVVEAFQAWKSRNIPIYIYSSGSVAAQKLLFNRSTAGDLAVFIDGYFDTTTGPKREQNSYHAIAKATNHPTGDILFVTDVWEEAQAAAQAGMKTAISLRPGNKDLPEHEHREIHRLTDLIS